MANSNNTNNADNSNNNSFSTSSTDLEIEDYFNFSATHENPPLPGPTTGSGEAGNEEFRNWLTNELRRAGRLRSASAMERNLEGVDVSENVREPGELSPSSTPIERGPYTPPPSDIPVPRGILRNGNNDRIPVIVNRQQVRFQPMGVNAIPLGRRRAPTPHPNRQQIRHLQQRGPRQQNLHPRQQNRSHNAGGVQRNFQHRFFPSHPTTIRQFTTAPPPPLFATQFPMPPPPPFVAPFPMPPPPPFAAPFPMPPPPPFATQFPMLPSPPFAGRFPMPPPPPFAAPFPMPTPPPFAAPFPMLTPPPFATQFPMLPPPPFAGPFPMPPPPQFAAPFLMQPPLTTRGPTVPQPLVAAGQPLFGILQPQLPIINMPNLANQSPPPSYEAATENDSAGQVQAGQLLGTETAPNRVQADSVPPTFDNLMRTVGHRCNDICRQFFRRR